MSKRNRIDDENTDSPVNKRLKMEHQQNSNLNASQPSNCEEHKEEFESRRSGCESDSRSSVCSTSISMVLYTKFETLLRCPVCLAIIFPPIMLCVTGHSFCERCYDLLTQCPICKKPLTHGRNYMLESLMEEMKLPCRHSSFGCDQVLCHHDRITHEQACLFKPFVCFDCGNEYSLDNFDKHSQECFSANIVFYTNNTVTSSEVDGKVLRTYSDELRYTYKETSHGFFGLRKVEGVGTFLRRLVRQNNIWSMWISLDRREADTKSLRCKLEMSDPERTLHLSYSGPVFSLVVPEKDIVDSGKCFSVAQETVLKLLDKNGKFRVMSEIIILNY